MSKQVTITIPVDKLGAYIASLDMGIGACFQHPGTHRTAGDYLSQLREQLMDAHCEAASNTAQAR